MGLCLWKKTKDRNKSVLTLVDVNAKKMKKLLKNQNKKPSHNKYIKNKQKMSLYDSSQRNLR
jgi:DNA replication protein DnaD